MTAVQKNAYLEAHMAVQQHMTQAALQLKASQARNEAGSSSNHNSPNVTSTQQYHNGSTIKVPQISSSSSGGADSTFTAVPDDVGMGYEGGVRVLQSLGNW